MRRRAPRPISAGRMVSAGASRMSSVLGLKVTPSTPRSWPRAPPQGRDLVGHAALTIVHLDHVR
jgi:hypothetical protein